MKRLVNTRKGLSFTPYFMYMMGADGAFWPARSPLVNIGHQTERS
jgi:hypothetical protein